MTEEQEQAQQDKIDCAKRPTASQLQIIELLANGLDQRQISDVLRISHETTRKQLMLARSRLRVATTEQAVALAAKQGWIRVDDYPRA